MADYSLLVSKQTEVMKLVLKHKFNPKKFDWIEGPDGIGNRVSTLTIPDNHFYFQFGPLIEVGFCFNCSPGKDLKRENGICIDWEDVKDQVETWLSNVKREIKAEEVLKSLYSGIVEYGLEKYDLSDEKFTEQEKAVLTQKVNLIYEGLKNKNMISTKNEIYIKAQLDHLINSLETMGKKDWFFVAFGIFVAIVGQTGLSTNESTNLFQSIWGDLTNFFQIYLR